MSEAYYLGPWLTVVPHSAIHDPQLEAMGSISTTGDIQCYGSQALSLRTLGSYQWLELQVSDFGYRNTQPLGLVVRAELFHRLNPAISHLQLFTGFCLPQLWPPPLSANFCHPSMSQLLLLLSVSSPDFSLEHFSHLSLLLPLLLLLRVTQITFAEKHWLFSWAHELTKNRTSLASLLPFLYLSLL
jgi:hypothetical protein